MLVRPQRCWWDLLRALTSSWSDEAGLSILKGFQSMPGVMCTDFCSKHVSLMQAFSWRITRSKHGDECRKYAHCWHRETTELPVYILKGFGYTISQCSTTSQTNSDNWAGTVVTFTPYDKMQAVWWDNWSSSCVCFVWGFFQIISAV